MASNIRIKFRLNNITINGKRLTINTNADDHVQAIRVDDNTNLKNGTNAATCRLKGKDGAAAATDIDPANINEVNIDFDSEKNALLAFALLKHKEVIQNNLDHCA